MILVSTDRWYRAYSNSLFSFQLLAIALHLMSLWLLQPSLHLASQEKLAVDTGLDWHRRRQSCSVIAPSTRCSSPSWDHFNFWVLRYFLRRPLLRALLYAGESLKKPNMKLQMVPPRTRRACGRCMWIWRSSDGYGARLVRIFRWFLLCFNYIVLHGRIYGASLAPWVLSMYKLHQLTWNWLRMPLLIINMGVVLFSKSLAKSLAVSASMRYIQWA